MDKTTYFFGVGFGRLPKATANILDEAATALGARFVNIEIPGMGYQYWFSCEDAGAFNISVERGVFAKLEVEGIAWPPEPLLEEEEKKPSRSLRPTVPVPALTNREIVWGKR
jgi:hypothetical protein